MDDMKAIERYKNDVCDAIKSEHFAYIAHPDLFFNRITEITPKILEFCREIVETAVKYNIPLELNLGGVRWNNIIAEKNHAFPYPNKAFFKIVGELGAKVVIGIDAHLPSDFSTSAFDMVMGFVKEFNLNLIKDFRAK
jgi:histidinol-phosphatase (PHP family)